MIHPSASADYFLAPLHRSFLIACFASGAAAMIILPLHLAFAGPPHAATILVLGWMLSQWPLALYLSRSGALNKAVGVSSSLFACFVAAVCMMTGGKSSFALLWLLIPPVEAALATNRKITVGITALCCALFAMVSLLSAPVSQFVVLSPEARVLASIGALIYVGMLAVRISIDRSLARKAVTELEAKRNLVSNHVSEVLFVLSGKGDLSVLGGPTRKMLGAVPSKGDRDWLFERLHVADRPLYLTRLAEVRISGDPQEFVARIRVGASLPGEGGQAEYHRFGLKLWPSLATLTPGRTEESLVLAVRSLDEEDGQSGGDAPTIRDTSSNDTRWNVIEEAGGTARACVSDIVNLATLVESRGAALSEGSLHHAARQIKAAGNRSADSLTAILDLVPETGSSSDPDYCEVDIFGCLDHSCNLLRPLADRLSVGIEIGAREDLPIVVVDRKKFRQSLHLVLSGMIETIGAGGVIDVTVRSLPTGLELLVCATNRKSSLNWSSCGSASALEQAAGLLEETGASLEIHTALGRGESIAIGVPMRSSGFDRKETEDRTNTGLPLAETA